MTAVLAIIHVGLAAAWVGGMAYSLFVVQPKLKKYFGADQDGREALTAVIASGNRWKVVGLIAVIALTGGGLLLIDHDNWQLHAVKGLLLLIATGIFWYVSWRHWPQRVLAIAAELPKLQSRLVTLRPPCSDLPVPHSPWACSPYTCELRRTVACAFSRGSWVV